MLDDFQYQSLKAEARTHHLGSWFRAKRKRRDSRETITPSRAGSWPVTERMSEQNPDTTDVKTLDTNFI